MKKQLLAAALCSVMLLTGCGAAPAVQPDNGSAPEDGTEPVSVVQRMDLDTMAFGGCASLTLAGNLAAAKAADTDYETAADQTYFSGTSEQAWQRLLSGTLDVVLAYEPDAETKKQLEAEGIEWIEVGRDALVFLSGANTQMDMTKEDILAAYQNGGSDTCTGYASAPGSEERDMFTAVFGTDDAGVTVQSGEDTLTAACPHTEGTICYTTYLSLLQNGKPQNTQVVAVDGILPNVREEEEQVYPLQVPYYIAVRSGTDENDPAMLLMQWLSSESGKAWLAQNVELALPEEEVVMPEAS